MSKLGYIIVHIDDELAMCGLDVLLHEIARNAYCTYAVATTIRLSRKPIQKHVCFQM